MNRVSWHGHLPKPEAGGRKDHPNYLGTMRNEAPRNKQGGVAMVTIRRTAWFFLLAIVMAGWMGVLGSFRGMAEASMIASHGGAGDLRAAEIAKVQTFLEQKVVMQKLVDYGVSPDEAMAKIRSMSDSELHQLSPGSGGDSA